MTVTIDQIVESKSYIGTLKSKSNPKTRKYWIGVENNMVVLNPELMASQLEAAKNKIAAAKKEGKEVLIISDKSLYREEVVALCEKTGTHYMNYKVPSGVLTNFETTLSRVKSMNELKSFIESEEFDALTKKEQLSKQRQLTKVEKIYKGIKNLKKKPDLVIILDGTYLDKFVDEVEKLKLDSIILVNSDFPRWWNEDQLVVTNVSYYKSIDFVMNYILN